MKPYDKEFDDIRPFYDSEIPDAMKRIVNADAFPLIASWVFPDKELKEVKQLMLSFDNIEQFQKDVMIPVNEQVIKRSIDKFTYHGLERLDPDKQYLFVSNHRDIMLDACLLNYILLSNGHHTSQITFGANLMYPGVVTDIGKSNKMFKVERGGKMRDFYLSSLILSRYIRSTIVDQKESVWIAQRNGRTKDGIDRTEPALINMFSLSEKYDKILALSELHIMPISISYEWECCDILKAIELYESRHERYVKKPGEDLNSILTGVLQQKGKVNFTFCPEITETELRKFENYTKKDYYREVATLIDRRINSAYMLTPNNYIAHDIRYGQRKYSKYYTQEQYDRFVEHAKKLNEYDVDEPNVLMDIFLGIYSNPINSKQK
jgi:hypothetical protein